MPKHRSKKDPLDECNVINTRPNPKKETQYKRTRDIGQKWKDDEGKVDEYLPPVPSTFQWRHAPPCQINEDRYFKPKPANMPLGPLKSNKDDSLLKMWIDLFSPICEKTCEYTNEYLRSTLGADAIPKGRVFRVLL